MFIPILLLKDHLFPYLTLIDFSQLIVVNLTLHHKIRRILKIQPFDIFRLRRFFRGWKHSKQQSTRHYVLLSRKPHINPDERSILLF